MAESGVDSATGKRKYDDSTGPPPPSSARRATGFSAPIIPPQFTDSAPSYNSVPPPLDEIQLAKQRAQEIAARLFNSAEAKRPKFDNGPGAGAGYDSNDGSGFSSGPTDYGQKSMLTTAPSMPSSYGYGNPSKKIEIPNGRVGVIIGKAGETIKYLQLQSGAKIQVTRDVDADPHSLTRSVELTGSAESIAKAEQLINDVLAEAESGGSGSVGRRVTGQTGGAEQFVMKVPNNKVGLVIGKGGDTIKNMQASTGARIQVIPLHLPPGDTSTERTVQIDGSSDQIEAAKQLVNEVISENRLRNPTAGRYSQQNYQAPPPSYGAPPGPQMQPQGYGYVQPGAYAGQPTYTQPPYTGWDQSATAPTSQGTGGYDYYNQPQTQTPPVGSSASTETSTYGYNQQGQAYSQDGYGGYAAAPQSGYGAQADNGNQAPPPASAGQPGYSQDPSPNPNPNPNPNQSYPPHGSTQPGYGQSYGYGGYGPPPVSQPPGSGYGQQASYPGGAYGGTGYGYGAPPPASYGGLQPPAYGGSYGGGGGGYPQQPAVYSTDAAAAPAVAQPSGGGAVPRASPQQS